MHPALPSFHLLFAEQPRVQELSDGAVDGDAGDCVALACGHVFHSYCLDAWKVAEKTHDIALLRCPTCKHTAASLEAAQAALMVPGNEVHQPQAQPSAAAAAAATPTVPQFPQFPKIDGISPVDVPSDDDVLLSDLVETQPMEETQPAETQPEETQPVETQPAGVDAGPQPAGAQPDAAAPPVPALPAGVDAGPQPEGTQPGAAAPPVPAIPAEAV